MEEINEGMKLEDEGEGEESEMGYVEDYRQMLEDVNRLAAVGDKNAVQQADPGEGVQLPDPVPLTGEVNLMELSVDQD